MLDLLLRRLACDLGASGRAGIVVASHAQVNSHLTMAMDEHTITDLPVWVRALRHHA